MNEDSMTEEVAAAEETEVVETAATSETEPAETEPAETEPAAEEDERRLDGPVEALLFSSEMPMPARRLADLTRSSHREVLEAIDRLNVHYGETGRAFRISEIAGGYQMVTTPQFGEILSQLHKQSVPTRLSRAALETLAIIAFKQPVTRAEVDRIRGVSASDRVLRHLIERKVVKIAGRAEAPGRPLLYGTTREFLSYFGFASLADMPRTDELRSMLAGGRMPGYVLDEDTGELVPADETEFSAAEDPGEDPENPGEEDSLPPEEASMGYPEEADGSPREAPEREALSHSGEESDDREGVPTS